MDKLDQRKRSEIMRRVQTKNTKPELRVRKLLYGMGYRYRLHVPTLPGKPDLVLRKHRAVIFVHGCFWHVHEGCRRGAMPSSNVDFWSLKLGKNVERDVAQQQTLRQQGWRVLVIWECQLADEVRIAARLSSFLS